MRKLEEWPPIAYAWLFAGIAAIIGILIKWWLLLPFGIVGFLVGIAFSIWYAPRVEKRRIATRVAERENGLLDGLAAVRAGM